MRQQLGSCCLAWNGRCSLAQIILRSAVKTGVGLAFPPSTLFSHSWCRFSETSDYPILDQAFVGSGSRKIYDEVHVAFGTTLCPYSRRLRPPPHRAEILSRTVMEFFTTGSFSPQHGAPISAAAWLGDVWNDDRASLLSDAQ